MTLYDVDYGYDCNGNAITITEDKRLQMMHEYAVKLSEAIPDNFNERIQWLEKSALLSYVSEFGDMP